MKSASMSKYKRKNWKYDYYGSHPGMRSSKKARLRRALKKKALNEFLKDNICITEN
jgi:hypothetical protein